MFSLFYLFHLKIIASGHASAKLSHIKFYNGEVRNLIEH